MRVKQPLILQALTIQPTEEWSPQSSGWLMARVSKGMGYCQYAGNTNELNQGDGFVLSTRATVSIRASRLGAMYLQFFEVHTDLLAGLLTLPENLRFKALAAGSPSYVSFFKSSDPTGKAFTRLARRAQTEQLSNRCAMLQLWANSVTKLFVTPEPVLEGKKKLRQRFHALINKTPETKLFKYSLHDLAQELHCSERHLSHLFREEFGISFHNHQSDLNFLNNGSRFNSVREHQNFQHFSHSA